MHYRHNLSVDYINERIKEDGSDCKPNRVDHIVNFNVKDLNEHVKRIFSYVNSFDYFNHPITVFAINRLKMNTEISEQHTSISVKLEVHHNLVKLSWFYR